MNVPNCYMKRYSTSLVSLALGLGFGLLYLSTLTQVHTFDALSYVLSVERKPWQAVFHPHHLAYGPLGVLALWLGKALGFVGGAALPMQVVNALAGACGVGLFAHLVLRITQRVDIALVSALLLGSSYAYWYYAIEIEVYTVATLLLIGCAGLLWRLSVGSRQWTFTLLGAMQGAAVLFHQTNLLLCGPIAVLALWMLWQQRSAWKPVLAGWLSYAGALLIMVVLPYVWVGFGVSQFGSWQTFWIWLTEYARTGWWGGPISGTNWEHLGQGLSETLTPQGGGWAWLGLLICGAIGLWMCRGAEERKIEGAGKQGSEPCGAYGSFNIQFSILLLLWLLVYGTFFFWWEPDNIEFWIACLPPMLLLLAASLCCSHPWRVPVVLVMGVALLLLGVNQDAIRRRGDASTDLQRSIAQALAERSTPADLLLIPDGLQELYLPYYEQHENFISLNQALFDQQANWNAACASIHTRIEAALHAGATALIADEALHPPQALLSRHGLSQAQVDTCFAQYSAALRSLSVPDGVPAYLRLAYAQEYADGAGWRFATGPLGWQVTNVRMQRFDGAWSFVPEQDPSLTSPLLRLDTAQIRAIEIEIENGTGASDAQLFFLGEDGLASEERSLRWTLEPGRQTYRLELEGVPGWQGIVTRLRIDPVGVGDGGELRVWGLRLIGKF